ncbi:RING-H2 finger protein ATL33-like [Punica granatum]|uniref:Uncharacterized protein n=2 Tax=Punica granatum TaxID=22663 RepID=A0A2I0L333_PUNGR|nr:RING-H2 finger protein ATL33-like [Punica granatum]PKI75119.1 hypothetical protein CRG98_004454 [Punica granatum]
MIFRDPRLNTFDSQHPDGDLRAPVYMYEPVPLSAIDTGTPSSDSWQSDLCDLLAYNRVPLDKCLEFLECIAMLASCTAELRESRGRFTVEANLDHIITDVVPATISRLLDHAREVKDLADLEAVHTCPICLDDMTSGCKLIETHCKHVFHIPCIVRWFKMSPTCPICRFGLLEDGM